MTATYAHNTEPTHGGELDLEESTVTWTGKKVTGSHTGTVAIKSGSLDFKNHQLVGGSFEIDMTTIVCTDLSANVAQKLVGHLSSGDFFGTADHPTASLVIKEISKSTKGDAYAINADLTIKGITKPVGFTTEVSEKGATAVITIDRTCLLYTSPSPRDRG